MLKDYSLILLVIFIMFKCIEKISEKNVYMIFGKIVISVLEIIMLICSSLLIQKKFTAK